MVLFMMLVGGLLSLGAFVCAIWMIVLAFRESAIWGLVSVFVPFGMVVFAIKYWQDSKKPFLGWAGCGVMSIVMFVIGGGMAANQMANEMMNDPEFQKAMAELESMDFEDFEDADPLPEVVSERIEPKVAPADPSIVDMAPAEFQAGAFSSSPALTVPIPELPSSYPSLVNGNQIRIQQADRFVGKKMRILGHTDIDSVATLVEAKRGALVFKRNFAGGEASFEIPRGEIKTLELVQ